MLLLATMERVALVLIAAFLAVAALGACVQASASSSGPLRVAHMTLVGCNRQESDQSFWWTAIAPTLAEEWRLTAGACGSAGSTEAPKAACTTSATRALTDVLLWTGAATYATIFDAGVEVSLHPRPVADIAGKYAQLSNNTYYRSFVRYAVESPVGTIEQALAEASAGHVQQRPPRAGIVLGAMDDQDLGLRGADSTYPQTAVVKAAYVDFLDAPEEVRKQSESHDGAYYISTLPTESESPLYPFFVNRLCTITLDVRTQRARPTSMTELLLNPFEFHSAEEERKAARRALREKRAGSQPSRADDHEGAEGDLPMDDLLGSAQWQWLEDTVAHYTSAHAREDAADPHSRLLCALTVIASPLQFFLNDDKPNLGWDSYPFSRSRLLALLQRHEATRFVFVSGHAEVGELGLLRAVGEDDEGSVDGSARGRMLRHYEARTPYPSLTAQSTKLLPPPSRFVVELTSAGLTHAANDAALIGWLYPQLVGPFINENAPATRFPFIARRVRLDRSTVIARHFATLTLQVSERGRHVLAALSAGRETVKVDDEALAKLEDALEVVWQIHTARPTGDATRKMAKARRTIPDSLSEADKDAALVRVLAQDVVKALTGPSASEVSRMALVERTLRLSQLASYAGSAAAGKVVAPTGHYTASPTRDPIPIFYMYNAPGDYPPVKRYTLYWGCEEVPCVPSSAFMIVKVIGALAIAGCVLGTAITVMCCANWHQTKIKRWWRRVRHSKVKKE